MFGPHSVAYQSLRGFQICRAKSCAKLGPLGTGGEDRCPNHTMASATPLPPEGRASFEDKEIKVLGTSPGMASPGRGYFSPLLQRRSYWPGG